MSRLATAAVLLALAAPALASAQTIDLGPDVSGYTRFVVYPHLQKGWESVQRGDRDRAFQELERARSLAPDSAAVALQLAAAYRKFGEPARAQLLLRDQLKRTPSDARVKGLLAELDAAARPAPAPVVAGSQMPQLARSTALSSAQSKARKAQILSLIHI